MVHGIDKMDWHNKLSVVISNLEIIESIMRPVTRGHKHKKSIKERNYFFPYI